MEGDHHVRGEPPGQCDRPNYRATMVWDGYIYQRERIGKNCSWWRCRKNRPRDREARKCFGRAVYKDQGLVITVKHTHAPESTSQNYIPSPCGQPSRKDLVAAVKGFVLSADQALLQSEVTHVMKHHRCDLCGMKFAIARVLETHKMLEHQVCAQWTCCECGMQFLQATCYSLHKSISHPCMGAQPDLASCSDPVDSTVDSEGQTKLTMKNVGNMVVKQKTNMDKEIDEPLTNTDKNLVEPKNNMEKKVEKSQKKEKHVYKCEYCSAEFPHPCKLKEHVRKHTGEKPYKCSLCPKTFTSGSKRGAHFKSAHNKDRKHLCNWCGKKFTNLKILSEHIRTHTGEKPYSCPVCFRQFTKRNAMVVHIRQHTGEKPYVCDQCGQSFTVNVSLRTHLKSKHNIIVNTTMPGREVTYGDSSMPTIGRPKRSDAEKQLFANRQNGRWEEKPHMLN